MDKYGPVLFGPTQAERGASRSRATIRKVGSNSNGAARDIGNETGPAWASALKTDTVLEGVAGTVEIPPWMLALPCITILTMSSLLLVDALFCLELFFGSAFVVAWPCNERSPPCATMGFEIR